jgi:hypothetical protein
VHSHLQYNSDGIESKTLPLTINNQASQATFQVDLQFRVEVDANLTLPVDVPGIPGIKERSDLLNDVSGSDVLAPRSNEVDLPGTSPQQRGLGGGVGVGIYVNVIELVANLLPTTNCTLESTESFNINAGAFFQANVALGPEKFNFAPTASTTFFQGPAFTQCIIPTGGLGFPTRSSALPTAASACAASQTVVQSQTRGNIAVMNAGLAGTTTTTVTVTATTTAKTLTASRRPIGTFSTTGEQSASQARSVASMTTLAVTFCASAVPNCPPDLQSVVETPTTICGPSPPTQQAACAVVTDVVVIPRASSPSINTFIPSTSVSSSTASLGGIFQEPSSTSVIAGGSGVPSHTPSHSADVPAAASRHHGERLALAGAFVVVAIMAL